MTMRYISNSAEEAIALLGEEAGEFVSKAIWEKLERDVRTRGFTNVETFVERMRTIVRERTTEAKEEAEATI